MYGENELMVTLMLSVLVSLHICTSIWIANHLVTCIICHYNIRILSINH